MSAEHYERAKKLGEKEAHARLQKNESPYLPVLDDILEGVTIDARVSLGLVDVPLDRIVGTATAGRTSAFAANFMPLLGEGTEFLITLPLAPKENPEKETIFDEV